MKFGQNAAGADQLATSKDPLSLYLSQAAAQTPETMRQKYMEVLNNNQASFGGGGGLSGALAQKIQSQGAGQVNDVIASRNRNMPLEYAENMVEPQNLVNMRARKIMGQKAAEQMRAAERAANKKATAGAVMSTVGAIGGAAIGGPAGAAIGGGAGGLIGQGL